MVHKSLVKRGWMLIVFGLILFFVGGPIEFLYFRSPLYICLLGDPSYRPDWLEPYCRMIVGSGIGAIGIIFVVFGMACLLAATILESMKKERYAHRSKTHE